MTIHHPDLFVELNLLFLPVVKKVDTSIVAAGVAPYQYPELVEFNPVIAYDVLICLMSTNQITDYFSGMYFKIF